VVFISLALTVQDGLLVSFEFNLGVLLLLDVLSLELFEFLFDVLLFGCFCYCLFLLKDHCVRLLKQSFDFLLVCVLDALLHVSVFFVFRVQVEDHLGKLGDLLRHLMMGLLCKLHVLTLEFKLN